MRNHTEVGSEDMKLREKQIGDVFEAFYPQLVPRNLKFVKREYSLGGQTLDFLFQDGDQQDVGLELKADAATNKDLGQVLGYKRVVPRVILAAPFISSSMKSLCDHYGIDYLEFDLRLISSLYKSMKDGFKPDPPEPRNPVVGRFEDKTVKDGNVAFKVTYVDSGWNGVCSHNLYEFNRKHRVWCGQGQTECGVDCQSEEFKNPDVLTVDNYPCFDSVAAKTLSFSPGVYQNGPRQGMPIRCLQAKVGKLAVFTSLEPGAVDAQRGRFVFAIAQISDVLPENDEREYEMISCKQDTGLIFEKGTYPNFWKYYQKDWRTGLFRYLDDNQVGRFLKDITDPTNGYAAHIREAASRLLRIVDR
jgi:hypothetical protein